MVKPTFQLRNVEWVDLSTLSWSLFCSVALYLHHSASSTSPLMSVALAWHLLIPSRVKVNAPSSHLIFIPISLFAGPWFLTLFAWCVAVVGYTRSAGQYCLDSYACVSAPLQPLPFVARPAILLVAFLWAYSVRSTYCFVRLTTKKSKKKRGKANKDKLIIARNLLHTWQA